jgi:AraC-like DNA-binding protein
MHATDFVSSYIDAWNRQDSQAVASHLAENGIYLDIPFQQNLSRAQLIEYLDQQFAEEANFYELTGEVLTGQHSIAFQYKVYPRESNSKPSVSATWHGAEFVTMRDGAAIEIADYYEQPNAQLPGSPLANATSAAHIQRYAKSGLSLQQMEQVKQQLDELMDAEKLYLRADLTLPELAETLACSVNHVSQAINAGFGVSFFDFINGFRVREAMQLLGDRRNGEPTVLSVALQVGFNSTSTFYVAFRKVTGQTPAQYRRAFARGTPAVRV